MSPKIFPIVLTVLDFGASITYLCCGDVRRACYWAFAGGLTICVTL